MGTHLHMAEGMSWQWKQTRVAVVEEEEEEVNCLKTLMVEELGAEQGSDLTAPSTSSVL